MRVPKKSNMPGVHVSFEVTYQSGVSTPAEVEQSYMLMHWTLPSAIREMM